MDPTSLFDQPFHTFSDLVRLQASVAGLRTALEDGGERLDYGGLDRLADGIAAALRSAGTAPGRTVALCGANSVRAAAVFVGILRAGAVAVPLPPLAGEAAIGAMLADADPAVVFVDGSAPALPERFAGRAVALTGDAAGQPFDAWLAAAEDRPDRPEIRPEDAFNIIYSSGTTGTPKGIVQSHAMRWSQIRRAPQYGYGPGSVTLIATPLYSNTTLVSFLPALAAGGTVVLMERFDPGRYLAIASERRVTHSMLVPVQYRRLLEHPDFDRADLTAFKAKFCTSAPFSADLKAEVLRRWPGALVEFYGMTEGGGTCILEAHAHPAKLHTVGKPVAGHDIRVIDESGQTLPTGAVGEVVGHSPAMMTGYHNRPEQSAAALWHDETGRPFMRTGDIGRFDADGFLTLLDRKKDMIISGGFNVFPSDLEAVLCEHPGVREVAVVGVPSERWGETPVAFVVPAGATTIEAEHLRAWTNDRVGKVQRLAAVELVDALPRSAIGKVLKRELRDLWLQRQGRTGTAGGAG